MVKLKITGMTCQHCAITVKDAIKGVEKVEVYFPKTMQKLKEILI